MWQEIHQGKCETHVLLFTSVSYERKHVSDLLMLVFCFRGHMSVVYLWTTKVHNNSVFKELTLHFLLQKFHLWNSPMPSDFHAPCPQNSKIVNPRSPSEILKAVHGIGMDIFWNRPICCPNWWGRTRIFCLGKRQTLASAMQLNIGYSWRYA